MCKFTHLVIKYLFDLTENNGALLKYLPSFSCISKIIIKFLRFLSLKSTS